MPSSVGDRTTPAHEMIYLLTKKARYFYDAAAIAEPVNGDPNASRNRWDTKDYEVPGQKPQKRTARTKVPGGWDRDDGTHGIIHRKGRTSAEYQETEVRDVRNKRSVWTSPTAPYPDAHFATFPPALIEPCILAGSRPGDIVFDPFMGSGTTGEVAQRFGRQWLGIELNPEYAKLAEARTSGTLGMAFIHEAA
jgi:site-specific DNA-methyltransferase (cytosine-N4-specific)